jgi:hypothetical protein
MQDLIDNMKKLQGTDKISIDHETADKLLMDALIALGQSELVEEYLKVIRTFGVE